MLSRIRWLTSRHVATRQAPDRHQIEGLEMIAIIQYASDGRDCSQSWWRTRSNHDRWIFIRRMLWEHRVDRDPIFIRRPRWSVIRPSSWWYLEHWISIRRRRQIVEELHDRGPIEPLSRRDRAAIGEFTWWNHRQSIGRRSTNGQDHDRGPIVAKMVAIWSKFKAKFTANSGASNRPEGIAPMTLANRLHDRSNDPRSSGQFPSLKAYISLLCSSTFDRFVKELNEFRGRSLVHRDPPAFRLDCEAIGAGLIVNFSLISSNLPLEFRTSTRKNPSKFASIHENWSPILAAIGLVVRFDRLSGGNLSFY